MMKFEIYVCEDPWHQLIWLERGIFCWTVVDLNSTGQVMCFRGKIHSTTVQVSLTVVCCVFDPLSVTCVFVCLSVTLLMCWPASEGEWHLFFLQKKVGLTLYWSQVLTRKVGINDCFIIVLNTKSKIAQIKEGKYCRHKDNMQGFYYLSVYTSRHIMNELGLKTEHPQSFIFLELLFFSYIFPMMFYSFILLMKNLKK